MQLPELPPAQFSEWLASGRVLEQDGRGPKIVALADGLMLKLFHSRHAAWRSRLFPPARAFARNVAALAQRDIVAPEVVDCFWIDYNQGLSGCRYRKLPGISLDRVVRETPEALQALLPNLARFVRALHRRGVYFRSLHPGNILLLDDANVAASGFGLIDVLDLSCTPWPLPPWKVRRNFRHFSRALVRRKLPFPIDKLKALYERS